jgi:transposase
MNGDAFTTYVVCVLAPDLSPGNVTIMDQLCSHKAPAVCAAIEAAGARLLFLPPYSPKFNPIEMAILELKAHLRKAAERAVHGL